MKKVDYKITPISVEPNDDLTNKIKDVLNKEGLDGWKLVHWETVTLKMANLPSTIPCWGSILILVLKREVKNEDKTCKEDMEAKG